MLQFSAKDKVIMHLHGARSHFLVDKPSDAMTQEGISKAIGINRTHVSRILKPMLDEGSIEASKGHVQGKERKLIYYGLTEAGLSIAKEILKNISDLDIAVRDRGELRITKVRELVQARSEVPILDVLTALVESKVLEIIGERLIASNVPLAVGPFLNREEQLEAAKRYIASEAKLLAIFAGYGYGSSTFMKKVALELWMGPVFWHDLEADSSLEGVKDALKRFSLRLGGSEQLESMRGRRALLCFDNYHDVREEIVDFLIEMNRFLDTSELKMAVAMRGETPSYNRFYQRSEVERGRVMEVSMHRFDERLARRLLGDDIDDEAFQVIYMITRGQPLALHLLKTGDAERLKKIRLSEEVRFLMYLRTKKKSS